MLIKLELAQIIAGEWINDLSSLVYQIEVAGSIRRKAPLVKDIELVAIPLPAKDLFGNERQDGDHRPIDTYLETLQMYGSISIDKNGEKYKKFIPNDHPVSIDLFLVTPPAQWGVQMMIRTGPSSFSKKIVTPKNKGGLLPSFLRVKDGCIWNKGRPLTTPTEQEFFDLLEIDYIKPEERE